MSILLPPLGRRSYHGRLQNLERPFKSVREGKHLKEFVSQDHPRPQGEQRASGSWTLAPSLCLIEVIHTIKVANGSEQVAPRILAIAPTSELEMGS